MTTGREGARIGRSRRPALFLSAPAAAALLAAALAGCAAAPVFEPPEKAIVWPAPPDPPRYYWSGELKGEASLKKPRGFFGFVADLFAGAREPAAFLSAHDVAVTPSGVVFVSDPEQHGVHRLDLENREYAFLTLAAGGRPLVTPIGLGYDAGRRLIWVADRTLGVAAAFDETGAPRGVTGKDLLEAPIDVAVSPSGVIAVTDVGRHQVFLLTPEGGLIRALGDRGAFPGSFNFPTFAAFDPGGRLFISDSLNARVQVFDPEGRLVAVWGRRGDMPGDFSQPKGVSCDSEGRLYVVDSRFENFQVFDPEGRLLLAVGHEGRGPGEFWLPVGIFVDAADRIWVADSFNRRVQVFGRIETPE